MRYPWPAAGPGRATSGRPTLQTSSNHHDLNRLARTSVTNVVNMSPKTTIISEKAIELTTFVTTGQKSTRKTPWIDDVCNNTHRATRQHNRPHWRGGRRRVLPRCRWAAAGPGRASRRRAERSSRRGRIAGGPPPTGTHSGRALRRPEHQRRPAHQRRNTPPRRNKAARPHRGRAAQPVSEAHRRTTTMSGSPRPLSWRTLEIPSLAATSFAVPSMRGSS